MSGLLASTPASRATARARMREAAEWRFRESAELPTRFFEAHADAISQTCLAMARRFRRGGRLLAFGEGSAATDAQHVAVEFVHPVLVGKRALPALSLGGDVAETLGVIGREADVAMGIAVGGLHGAVGRGLLRAHGMRMLTVALAGGDAPGLAAPSVDHVFVVPSGDAMLVQEVQETVYHVLWELVHVFLENEAAS